MSLESIGIVMGQWMFLVSVPRRKEKKTILWKWSPEILLFHWIPLSCLSLRRTSIQVLVPESRWFLCTQSRKPRRWDPAINWRWVNGIANQIFQLYLPFRNFSLSLFPRPCKIRFQCFIIVSGVLWEYRWWIYLFVQNQCYRWSSASSYVIEELVLEGTDIPALRLQRIKKSKFLIKFQMTGGNKNRNLLQRALVVFVI